MLLSKMVCARIHNDFNDVVVQERLVIPVIERRLVRLGEVFAPGTEIVCTTLQWLDRWMSDSHPCCKISVDCWD